jgi:hypothetical protein
MKFLIHQRYRWRRRYRDAHYWLIGQRRDRRIRGRRGWAPRDAWNVDTYMCRVGAEMLTHLRDNGIGYPAGSSMEKYQEQLTRIIEPLAAWGDDSHYDLFGDEEAEAYHEAQKAWRRFGEMLGGLWD